MPYRDRQKAAAYRERRNARRRELRRRPDVKAREAAYFAAYQKAHPERWRIYAKTYKERCLAADPLDWKLRKLKTRAKRYGIRFDLVPADFTLPTHCPVLGIPLVLTGEHAPGLLTFDRVIPARGYVRGNVNIVSYRANRLKSDCTDPSELRAVADYIEREVRHGAVHGRSP